MNPRLKQINKRRRCINSPRLSVWTHVAIKAAEQESFSSMFFLHLAIKTKKQKQKTKQKQKQKPLIFNPTAPQVSGPPASGGTERKQPSGTLPFRSAVKEGETRGNGPFITGRQGGDCSSWQWLPNKAWDHRTPLIWLPLRGPWSSARVPPGPTGRLSSPDVLKTQVRAQPPPTMPLSKRWLKKSRGNERTLTGGWQAQTKVMQQKCH